jgi:hypothetical protein
MLDDDVYVQVLNSSAFFALWLLWLHLHRVAKCCLTRGAAAVEACSRNDGWAHACVGPFVWDSEGTCSRRATPINVGRLPSHPGPDHRMHMDGGCRGTGTMAVAAWGGRWPRVLMSCSLAGATNQKLGSALLPYLNWKEKPRYWFIKRSVPTTTKKGTNVNT